MLRGGERLGFSCCFNLWLSYELMRRGHGHGRRCWENAMAMKRTVGVHYFGGQQCLDGGKPARRTRWNTVEQDF